MIKALEALEVVKQALADFYRVPKERTIFDELDIIEKALKDYEMERTLRIRLENINYYLVREKQENEKKLKALVIIKKKQVDVYRFMTCKTLTTYNLNYIRLRKNELRKYEYNLLKEILLWVYSTTRIDYKNKRRFCRSDETLS